MKEYKMTEALNGISDELLLEAAQMTKKKSSPAVKLLRIAAIAAAVAILITAVALWPAGDEAEIIAVPGVIKAYACETEAVDDASLEKFALTDAADTYTYTYYCYENRSDQGIPFIFELNSDYYEAAEIRFILTADKGGFFTSTYHGAQPLATKISTARLDTVYWAGLDVLFEPPQQYVPLEPFFAYVLVYADEHLVGYGVLDLIALTPEQEDVVLCVSTRGFTAYCFPKIDGEYQQISEKYVWDQIEALIKTKGV